MLDSSAEGKWRTAAGFVSNATLTEFSWTVAHKISYLTDALGGLFEGILSEIVNFFLLNWFGKEL